MLVIALDAWGERVAGLLPTTPRTDTPALAILLGTGDSDQLRKRLQERSIPYLSVRPDGDAVWVGPLVLPGQGGCEDCWQARRRQHAETLDALAEPSPADDADSARLAARATAAVVRRALRAPADEAGGVRRFAPGGAVSHAGRVVAVTGCRRCDGAPERLAGWALRPPARRRDQPRVSGKEVKTHA
jgi:bacteriocin biosynthesis cyclodehydratase domain-containing protein